MKKKLKILFFGEEKPKKEVMKKLLREIGEIGEIKIKIFDINRKPENFKDMVKFLLYIENFDMFIYDLKSYKSLNYRDLIKSYRTFLGIKSKPRDMNIGIFGSCFGLSKETQRYIIYW